MLGVALLVARAAESILVGGSAGDALRSPPGVTFEPAVDPVSVTPADAIRAAGGPQPSTWRLVLMTNPNVGPGLSSGIGPKGLVRRPVYVLQYDNVPLPLYGPDTTSDDAPLAVGFAQTYIDATTRDVLYVVTFGDPGN